MMKRAAKASPGRRALVFRRGSESVMRVEMHRGREGLRRIRDEWQRVTDKQFRQRFIHWYGWHEAALSTLETEPDKVHFFLIRRGGAAVAVLPLKAERSWLGGIRVRRWRLPRHAHLPLADIPCAAGVSIVEVMRSVLPVLQHFGGGWDVVEFSPVLQESPLAAAPAKLPAMVHVTREKTCDQVDCSGGFDDVKSRFSRNFRSNLNKARNKLERHDDVRVSTVSTQPRVQSAFEEFLALEASGWKGVEGSGTAIALHARLVEFYQALIDRLEGNVVINGLHVDGRMIAGQFCVRDRDTLYILKLAYDEDHARLAPGNMLLERVIRAGTENGDWRYVNLVGNPSWFQSWAPQSQDICAVRLCNHTLPGIAMRLALATKSRLLPAYRWFREHISDRRGDPR